MISRGAQISLSVQENFDYEMKACFFDTRVTLCSQLACVLLLKPYKYIAVESFQIFHSHFRQVQGQGRAHQV